MDEATAERWCDAWELEAAGRPTTAAARHLRGLAWLRGVRDRIDREYAHPLNV